MVLIRITTNSLIIMNKIEDYNFDKNDWAHFHDVVLDVTWDNGKVNLN